MEPRRLGDSLSILGQQLGIAPAGTFDSIVNAWPVVAGRLAELCTPASLRDGNLTVTVGDPALVEAVEWSSGDWCRQLREKVPEAVVERVVARLART